MIDRLGHEISEFLQRHEAGYLAVNGPDGPWASLMPFVSVGLTLYLIEPQTSDLIFYLENDPRVVFTIDEDGCDPSGPVRTSVQILGMARIVHPNELSVGSDKVQSAYDLKGRQAPGVYVMVEVKPARVYRITHDNGATHRETMDIDAGCE